MTVELIIPAFIAGVLTFLAPCTLPLVPGYLGFISGVNGQVRGAAARRKIFLNGLLFVIGFSVVLVALGSLAGLAGTLLGQYRWLLARAGGVFVILFGLYMTGILRLPALRFLDAERHVSWGRHIKPGSPVSSFLFGAVFALGWTPCVGPILGAVLTLAATSTTVGQGAFLLAVFALGLGVPFLLVAAAMGQATRVIGALQKYLKWVGVVGGVFLIFIGGLLLTNTLGIWVSFFYRLFGFIEYERLLDYL